MEKLHVNIKIEIITNEHKNVKRQSKSWFNHTVVSSSQAINKTPFISEMTLF
jgi:hypothetical protein